MKYDHRLYVLVWLGEIPPGEFKEAVIGFFDPEKPIRHSVVVSHKGVPEDPYRMGPAPCRVTAIYGPHRAELGAANKDRVALLDLIRQCYPAAAVVDHHVLCGMVKDDYPHDPIGG